MMTDNKDQPSVPANEGLIMSGTPTCGATRGAMLPGIKVNLATGMPSQTVWT